MGQTLNYIAKKYALDLNNQAQIEIPNVGRDDLAKLFAELGFTKGAEIGVERGVYAEILCKNNPELHLYCIDPWTGYSGFRDIKSPDRFDGLYKETQKRLKPLNCTIIKKFSLDAVNDLKPHSLDFVYIDANHKLRYVIDDLTEWSGRVRSGGIIAGHDYWQAKDPKYNRHVVEAVNAYVQVYKIRPLFLLGRKSPLPGEFREKYRSWFFIKE